VNAAWISLLLNRDPFLLSKRDRPLRDPFAVTNDISGYSSYDVPGSEGRKESHEFEADIEFLLCGNRRCLASRKESLHPFKLPTNTNAIGHHLELFAGRNSRMRSSSSPSHAYRSPRFLHIAAEVLPNSCAFELHWKVFPHSDSEEESEDKLVISHHLSLTLMLTYALCFPHELILADQKLQLQALSLLPKVKEPPQACLVTRKSLQSHQRKDKPCSWRSPKH